jgi:CRISPR-associated protein Cas1
MRDKMKMDDPTLLKPLIRVMALHALLYCERLFYLEEVEGIQVADENVYAGRTLHEELDVQKGEEKHTIDVASESLGLIGKIDAIHYRDGSWIPYEHKKGRPKRNLNHEAWPADKIQVTAYGMLLEEHIGKTVLEGRIRYHQENITVRVPLDGPARQMVFDAVIRGRSLREQVKRPPITPNERLCIKCSLAPICLPEEERVTQDKNWETIRLFPASSEGLVIHITTHGSRIKRSGNSLVIEKDEKETINYPIHEICALVIHGYAQITTQAIHLCASHRISIHWLTGGGRYVGGLSSNPSSVQRRIRQYEALNCKNTRLQLARKLVQSRIEGQLRYLLRTTRNEKPRPDKVEKEIQNIRQALKEIQRAEKIDSLRGYEGIATKAYFSSIPQILSSTLSDNLKPDGRTRRPPRDRFNALLSFGYALLYRLVLENILIVGLEPAFGFYHTPRSPAHPLVLDIMELFRLSIWDIALIGSLNRRQWDETEDFMVSKDQVWLSDTGKKKAINLFESRIEEKWKHPVLKYSLSYARTIELEIRLLEKEWSGRPGMFARSRLR